MNVGSQPIRAVIVDVDGVVSPVHGAGTAWGDDVVAGRVFGPVIVSPTMCTRLDQLNRVPGVDCWWLTSWDAEMRERMDPFPGREWPVITDLADAWVKARGWWKFDAVGAWLDRNPQVQGLAWCDDHLRGGRPPAIRRRLAQRGIDPLLLTPKVEVGLTPEHLDQLDAWAKG